jgi:predicted dehydrogenase
MIPIPAKDRTRISFGRVVNHSKLDAIAIIGLGLRKTWYTEKALSLGKHVLVDFPMTHDIKKMSRLWQIAEERELCFYSPNLLRTESAIQELKRIASSLSHNVLSFTITCGMNTSFRRSDCAMKLMQLLDLLEWITESKCLEINGMMSTNHHSARAFVVTFSLEGGVRGLVNLYSAAVKSSPRLWIDGIFEGSLVHVDPYAQAVRVSWLGGKASKSLNWAPSSMSIALGDFVACIGAGRSSIPDKMERIFGLVHDALDI